MVNAAEKCKKSTNNQKCIRKPITCWFRSAPRLCSWICDKRKDTTRLIFFLLPVSWQEVRPSLVCHWQQTLLSVDFENARNSQTAFWSHFKQALQRPKVTWTSHCSQLSSFYIYSACKLVLQWAGWLQRYSLYFQHHWCHTEATEIIIVLNFHCKRFEFAGCCMTVKMKSPY